MRKLTWMLQSSVFSMLTVLAVSLLVLAGVETRQPVDLALAQSPDHEQPPVPLDKTKKLPTLDRSLYRLIALPEDPDAPGLAPAAGDGAGSALASNPDSVDGFVVVVTEAAAGRSPELQRKVQELGGSIRRVRGNKFRAALPVSVLADVAAVDGVNFVRQPHKPVPYALSEGLGKVNAIAWHAAGINGAGVKVAVVDLGFAGYANSIDSGDLPAGVITRSFGTPADISGGGMTHGTRVAEIVHDMAPGATLYLVQFGDEFDLADAVDWLISENVDVINHSVGWWNTGPGDGTGPIADIVTTARNSGGILWVNAIGNHAQRHWNGIFNDPDEDDFHNFREDDVGNSIFANAGDRIFGYLRWDDWPVSDQDYDLVLCRSSDSACARGANRQDGSQPPTESVGIIAPTTGAYYFAILRSSATEAVNFDLISSLHNLEYPVASGSFGAPADSPNALAVGAARWNTGLLQRYSSRGPNKNGIVRPDITAPDCTTDSFGPDFCGTSGSAPHVAGAAALVKQANPGFTPQQIQSYLETRSVDRAAPGKDNRFGWGRLSMGAPPARVVSGKTTLQLRSGTGGRALVRISCANFNADAVPADDGTWRIADVPAGPCVLTAMAPGYISAHGQIAVGPANVSVPANLLLGGDANKDGVVALNDITRMIAHFAQPSENCEIAGGVFDANCDGMVALNDITGAIRNFGQSGPQLINPPGPS